MGSHLGGAVQLSFTKSRFLLQNREQYIDPSWGVPHTRPILSIVSPELPLEQWQIAYGSMQDHARVSEPKGANLVHKNCYSWTVLVRRKEGVRWECFRARSPDARVR